MAYNNILDLISGALPDDLAIEDIYNSAPAEKWHEDPDHAAELALNACPRLDWQAYLEFYQDIKMAGADPCRHFLQHGLFEGRKLFSLHPLKEINPPGAPLISIIIAVYNNGPYLRKCLESALNQTLCDIEIIAVDDASNDNSLAMLEDFASRDSRLKIIRNERNSGIFATRKKGVLAARGEYFKFMDGDDYLTPDSCEIGYAEISKGFDIVEAGTKIINMGNIDKNIIEASHKYFNAPGRKIYRGNEILKGYFEENTLAWCLWNKIFLREICQAACQELEDGFFVGAEDAYAFCAIGAKARSLLKIDTPLYCYHYGSGVTTKEGEGKNNALWFKHGEALLALEKYIVSHSIDIDFEKVKHNQCYHTINKWLSSVDMGEAAFYYDLIRRYFGIRIILNTFMRRFSGNAAQIARKFRPCVEAMPAAPKDSLNIGIIYAQPFSLKSLYLLGHMAPCFASIGGKVSIFTERGQIGPLRQDEKINQNVAAIFGIDMANAENQMADLANAILNADIDIMVYIGAITQTTLWSLILQQGMGIPMLINYDGNFATPYYGLKRGILPYQDQEPILGAAAVVLCYCQATELYLRARGVNAHYLPYPLDTALPDSELCSRNMDIAVFADPGDDNAQISESLLVFKEVLKICPGSRMVIIGSYINELEKRDIAGQARQLGVEQRLIIKTYKPGISGHVKNCAVLLSTAFNESFSHGIGMAQANGIPCVAYAMPACQLDKATGMEIVPQGDAQGAAEAIARILRDRMAGDVSVEADTFAAAHSPALFCENLSAIIANFQKLAPIRQYPKQDYDRIIKAAASMACRKL